MKLFILATAILFSTSITCFGANGDVVVNGNLSVGTATPQASVHSSGKTNFSLWGGDTAHYYGGGAGHYYGIFGDSFGNGGAYTYGAQNTNGLAEFGGGETGGYFAGGPGGALAGGGAGVVAIGGAGYSQYLTQGGAGIYAQGGLNGDGVNRAFAGYFNGNTVIMNGNVGIGTTTPSSALQVIGAISGTTKNFDIPDPRYNDNDVRLVHTSIEGPEAAVFYRGLAQMSNGQVTVTLPAYFEALTKRENRTVILTAKYEGNGQKLCSVAASDVVDGVFSIVAYGGSDSSTCNHKVYWEVKAERSDVARQPAEQNRKRLKPNLSDFPPVPGRE